MPYCLIGSLRGATGRFFLVSVVLGESFGDGDGCQVIWFCLLMSIYSFPSEPSLTTKRNLPSLQKTFLASVLCVFWDKRASLISRFKSDLRQAMGGRSLTLQPHFVQLLIPTITIFVPFCVPFLFPPLDE